MRPAVFASLFLAIFACSEPDTAIRPLGVRWMEWPAEIDAATPFPVRLIGDEVLPCVRREFLINVRVEPSIVTFEPYYLFAVGDRPCSAFLTAEAREPRIATQDNFAPIWWDTTASAPGLTGDVPLTYTVRARAGYAGTETRAFGEIRVGVASSGRRNAGGFAHIELDTGGCMRVQVAGMNPGYALENPHDTLANRFLTVKGYIYEPATPLCGDTEVFHLVTP